MSVSSVPASTDYSSPYVTAQPAATVGQLFSTDRSLSPTNTTNLSTVASAYRTEYQTLATADAQELINGSFGSSTAANQPSATFGSQALISATTANTVNVLAQFAAFQDVGYQTAATEQTAATAAFAKASAIEAQDDAVLAAPIHPTDPYAAAGSGDPLNLLGQTVDATA